MRPYRPGVGIILINADGHVFVGQRIDTEEPAWQMPQGGVDDGESPAVAALREMREETGTDKAVIVGESADWYAYDLPSDLADKVWHGRYRGQKQKWFVLRFTGSDADIDISGPHPEFSRWRWAEPENLTETIVSFKRELYRRVLKELLPVIRGVGKLP
ncbi:MAG: RNA pyrophosphohydrolase [Alphaproteobacteria bacterium]